MNKPVELPRHVKKPGEWKLVSTQEELDAALADGWVLKLKAPKLPSEAETDAADRLTHSSSAPYVPHRDSEPAPVGTLDGIPEPSPQTLDNAPGPKKRGRKKLVQVE